MIKELLKLIFESEKRLELEEAKSKYLNDSLTTVLEDLALIDKILQKNTNQSF